MSRNFDSYGAMTAAAMPLVLASRGYITAAMLSARPAALDVIRRHPDGEQTREGYVTNAFLHMNPDALATTGSPRALITGIEVEDYRPNKSRRLLGSTILIVGGLLEGEESEACPGGMQVSSVSMDGQAESGWVRPVIRTRDRTPEAFKNEHALEYVYQLVSAAVVAAAIDGVAAAHDTKWRAGFPDIRPVLDRWADFTSPQVIDAYVASQPAALQLLAADFPVQLRPAA